MLDDFLVRAAVAGMGVTLAAAPLGCFILWRRMAFFGDATAHASLLGVALALALSVPVLGPVLLVALALAVTVALLTGRGYPPDTMLAVFSHGGLALGLLALALMPAVRVDLEGLLLGDILAIGHIDIAVIWAGALLVLGLLTWRWSRLLLATLSPDLAQASGVDPHRERLVLLVALALVVTLGLKVVGALLISALLILPAAAARPLVRSPEAMAILAALAGGISALGGLGLAFALDTPAGPTIVGVATALVALGAVAGTLRR